MHLMLKSCFINAKMMEMLLMLDFFVFCLLKHMENQCCG